MKLLLKEKNNAKTNLDQKYQDGLKRFKKVLISIMVPLEVWTPINISKEKQSTVKKINKQARMGKVYDPTCMHLHIPYLKDTCGLLHT